MVGARPDGLGVRVDRDMRVRATTSEAECAEMILTAAKAMDLHPLQAFRTFRRLARSKSTLYRDWDRAPDPPKRRPTADD